MCPHSHRPHPSALALRDDAVQRRVSSSIPRRVALHAFDIRRAVGRAACALAFPDHLAQAVHRGVVGFVQRVAFGGQQLDGLADAARLVNRALLAD